MTRKGTPFCSGYLFVVVCSFAGEFLTTSGAQAQQEVDLTLKDRLIKEAPMRWEEYTERCQQLQGNVSFQMSGTYQDTKVHNSYDMKRNEKCKLLTIAAERTRGGKQDYKDLDVFGINPRYAFALRRKSPTSPWVVSQLIDRRHNQLPPAFEEHFKSFERGNNELVKVSRYPLVEMIRKPEFRVVHCRIVRQAGEELVETVFDSPHKVEKGGNDIQGGTLILDPQHFWCLRSYEIRLESEAEGYRGTEKFQVLELGETDRSLPVPKRAVRERRFVFADGSRNEQELRLDYNLSMPRSLPNDEEFTLSAFGLPEPPGLAWKRPIRWYLWVGLAGIVCLILGVGFRRLRRRKAASA